MKKKQVLLVIESSRAYGRGLIQGITRYVQETNNWVVHFEEQGILTAVPPWLREWEGDGVICRTGVSPLGSFLRTLDCPLVELLGDGVRYVSEVQSDASLTARAAVEHFLERGFRHFAYYSYGNSWWGSLRGKHFSALLAEKGHSCNLLISRRERKYVSFPVWTNEYEQPLIEWLESLPKPVAVWTAADTVAQRVHNACLKIGIAVPDQIALLGTDNDQYLCNVLTPPLSSVEPNPVRIGYEAAKLLDIKMRGKGHLPNLPIRIPPLGVVTRQSTDIIAVDDKEMIRVARTIRQEALNGLQVNDLVRDSHLSKRSLERRFKKCFGRTIDYEIVQIRINYAKQLLTDTLLPIAEVGEQSGFDGNYFIKAFRRIVGVSPREFRRKYQVGGRPISRY